MVNSKKIKGRIAELGFTQKDVANELGLAQATICQKINNIRPMTLDEADEICKFLKIEKDDFLEYFFYTEVA